MRCSREQRNVPGCGVNCLAFEPRAALECCLEKLIVLSLENDSFVVYELNPQSSCPRTFLVVRRDEGASAPVESMT
jgi:hypothetical protein